VFFIVELFALPLPELTNDRTAGKGKTPKTQIRTGKKAKAKEESAY
jgi:hypothetical protein